MILDLFMSLGLRGPGLLGGEEGDAGGWEKVFQPFFKWVTTTMSKIISTLTLI